MFVDQLISTIPEISQDWVIASSLLGDRKALFSTDKVYRYALIITWDADKSYLVVIMLNPSTADEFKNDPTIERQERRARAMGHGGLIILNIFALRSTDRSRLLEVADPIGPLNDRIIALFTAGLDSAICGWGEWGNVLARGPQVLAQLRSQGIVTMAFKINKDGSPRHPLYVAYKHQPVAFSE